MTRQGKSEKQVGTFFADKDERGFPTSSIALSDTQRISRIVLQKVYLFSFGAMSVVVAVTSDELAIAVFISRIIDMPNSSILTAVGSYQEIVWRSPCVTLSSPMTSSTGKSVSCIRTPSIA